MFRVTIEEKIPYNVKTTKYEAADGKRYSSMYNIADGVEYKTVEIETGEINHNTRQVLVQEVDSLDLANVIKAINNL